MNLTSLLEAITRRQRERSVSKWTTYRELVAQVCDGKEPDPDMVAMVLADNNRTLDDLRYDSLLLTKRRKLREQLDAIEPLEAEDHALSRQISAGEKELERLTEQHSAKMSPFYARRFEINRIRNLANDARRELRATCEDEELLRQYKELEPQLHDAEQQRATIEREISQLQSWMAGDEHEASITQFPSERKRYSERVEEHKRRIESFEAKLPELNDRIHGLSQELETLERQFLNP